MVQKKEKAVAVEKAKEAAAKEAAPTAPSPSVIIPPPPPELAPAAAPMPPAPVVVNPLADAMRELLRTTPRSLAGHPDMLPETHEAYLRARAAAEAALG